MVGLDWSWFGHLYLHVCAPAPMEDIFVNLFVDKLIHGCLGILVWWHFPANHLHSMNQQSKAWLDILVNLMLID